MLYTPARQQSRRLTDIVIIAIFFALAAGLIQVAAVFLTLHGRGHLVFLSRDYPWMVPIAYLAIMLSLGVAIAVVAMVAPPRLPATVPVFIVAWVAVFSVLLPLSALASWASALLAAGAATQAARTFGGATERWMPRLLRSSAAMAVLVLLLGVSGRVARRAAERSALAALPAANPDAPNVLLIILDTVRAASLSLYGYSRATTPNLERYAHEGVMFEQAYATAPWTLPSHSSMFTGYYPHDLSADFLTPLDARWPTIAEAFAKRGYATAGFMANELYTAWDSGLDRGFQHWEDYKVSWRQILLSAWPAQVGVTRSLLRAKSWAEARAAVREFDLAMPVTFDFDDKYGTEVSASFLAWEASRRSTSGAPWFAVLNYFDAHRPRHSPPAFVRRFTSQPRGPDSYDGAIAYIDDEIGGVLDELRRRQQLDRTVVIVTADHGELLGEHKLFGHATNLYRQVLQVPLVIRYPVRVAAGTRFAAPVTLRDLAATVIDLADLPESRFPGVSLVGRAGATAQPSAAGENTDAGGSALLSEVTQGINLGPNYPASRGPMQSMIAGGMHYIRNGDGQEELYDLVADQGETNDLARTEQGRSRVISLRAKVAALAGTAQSATSRRDAVVRQRK